MEQEMSPVYTAPETNHVLPRDAKPMSIGKRIIVAAIGTVGITAALGLAVEQIGSAPTAPGAAIVASPASTAPAGAPGVVAVSWCPSPPTNPGGPANPGQPRHLPRVVRASNSCYQGTTSGSVSGPD